MSAHDAERCRRALELLADYLDREISEEELAFVEAHLSACGGCAERFEFEAKLIRVIKTKLRTVKAPEHLAAKIQEMLRRLEG